MPPFPIYPFTSLAMCFPEVPTQTGAITIMQQIQEFLNTIPSTVIAVLGTLFGVLLTLCVNNFVIWKLAHKKAINDAISEKRQREMELRIGVYLPAVEEVTILQSYISTIAQRSLNDTSIIEKMTASLNKILLVGSEETIRSLQAITNKLSEGFYVLLLERMELDYLNQEILNLQTRAQHLGNTIAGLLQQCQPSSTNPNPIMSDGLSAHISRLLDEQGMTQAAIEAGQKNAMTCMLKLNQESMLLTNEIGRLSVDLLCAARREMDIPLTWEDEYRVLAHQSRDKAKENFDNFLQELRNRINS